MKVIILVFLIFMTYPVSSLYCNKKVSQDRYFLRFDFSKMGNYDPHNIQNQKPPFSKELKSRRQTLNKNYYRVYFDKNKYILRVDIFDLDGKRTTKRTFFYEHNVNDPTKKIITRQEINYDRNNSNPIKTPLETIVDIPYKKIVIQYQNNIISSTSYFDKKRRVFIKLFYSKQEAYAYKKIIFAKEGPLLIKEIYYQSHRNTNSERQKHWNWHKFEQWVHFFENGQLRKALYIPFGFSYREKKPAYIHYSYDNDKKKKYKKKNKGLLISKEEYVIKVDIGRLIKKRLVALSKKGNNKLSVNKILINSLTYYNLRIVINRIINKKTKKRTSYYNSNFPKRISYYWKNGYLKKINHFRDKPLKKEGKKKRNLYKTEHFDQWGHLSKIDRYTHSGDLIFVEE